MLFEVNFLGEASVATVLLAGKGFLASVDSQVVNEVMPLSEVQVTHLVIAFQDSDHSVGFWILKFVNSVSFSFW